MPIEDRIVAVCVLLTTIVIGGLFLISNPTKQLSESEKDKILTSIQTYSADENDDLGDLDKLVSENIGYFNQKDKDTIIDSYLKSVYEFVGDLDVKLSTVGYELDDVIKEYDIKVNEKRTYYKIPKTHATVKGFLEELNTKGFSLKLNEDTKTYYIDVNIEQVLSKYEKYMSESLKKYLEFSVYEMREVSFIDEKKREIGIDEVVKRILMIEDGIALDKKQGYQFIDNWTKCLEGYYNILFGLSHDYFISSEYVKDEIITKYTEIVKENEGTKLAQDLNKVINILNKNGKNFNNSTQVDISKIIEDIYTDEIKEAISEKHPENEIETDIDEENEGDKIKEKK